MPKRQLVVIALLVSVGLLIAFAATHEITLNTVGVAASAFVVGCLTMCLVGKPRPQRVDRAERVERVAGMLVESNANLERAAAQLKEMKQQHGRVVQR